MLAERKREFFKVKNRHTGEMIGQSSSWRSPSLRGMYFGVCHPWDLRSPDLRGVDLAAADLTRRPFQPSKWKAAGDQGFRARMETRGGRRVLNARRAKGRTRLIP